LAQAAVVREALSSRGDDVTALPCTLDLQAAADALRQSRPDVVFNLVEALGGADRWMPLATLLFEGLGLPFTGADTAAMLATSDKLAAKRRLRVAGLPTPDWIAAEQLPQATAPDPGESHRSELRLSGRRRMILKPIWEHASLGMGDDAVVDLDPDAPVADARHRLELRERITGRPYFAEAYIPGREFNLSLLTDAAGGPLVLPPAEIDFSAYPAGKPRIVGHAAKWDESSFEYQQTPRRFSFSPDDAPLLAELAELARRCWELFGLRGYSRVDFRVDEQGRPWILEVNVNPCLAPDAGFAAALEQAGLSLPEAIGRIVDAAR